MTLYAVRPWGNYYHLITPKADRWVKMLNVKPGAQLSLQAHKARDEVWVCIAGVGRARVRDESLTLYPGKVVLVPQTATHRITNDGEDMLQIIEVATGLCNESDITRYEDDYGRC